MHKSDDFRSAYYQADALLDAAAPECLHEVIRLLACQAAYARRYREYFPPEALRAQIGTGGQDAIHRALVTEAMTHLVEILRWLDVGITPSGEPA
jgi:hypothetical protein